MSRNRGNTNSNRTASGEVFETNNLMCKNAATFYKMVRIQKQGGVGTGLRVHAPAAFTDVFQVNEITPTDAKLTISIDRLQFVPERPDDWEGAPPETIHDAINRLAAMIGPVRQLPEPEPEPEPEQEEQE